MIIAAIAALAIMAGGFLITYDAARTWDRFAWLGIWLGVSLVIIIGPLAWFLILFGVTL